MTLLISDAFNADILVLFLMFGIVDELNDVFGVESRLNENPASSSSIAFPLYTVLYKNKHSFSHNRIVKPVGRSHFV